MLTFPSHRWSPHETQAAFFAGPSAIKRQRSAELTSASRRPNGAVTAAQFRRLSKRVEEMESELNHIKRAWDGMGTSRQGVREQVEKNRGELGVQFQRIAMMQAEIDRLKANETALQAEIAHLRAKNPRVGA
jgi:chromosome segregation ATPase